MQGYVGAIEDLTKANSDFRRVVHTAAHLQLVLMALKPAQLAQAVEGLKRLSANGLRYPIPPYGVQMDVRAGMQRSYGDKKA